MKLSDNILCYVISLSAYIVALSQTLFTTSGEILGFSFQKEQINFFKSINILKNQGYEFLSYVLIFFVLVLPILKYITLLLNIYKLNFLSKGINNTVLYMQKYAMVDVFVIAILLIGTKNNPIFHLKIEIGTYALLLSVLMAIPLSFSLYLGRKNRENLMSH